VPPWGRSQHRSGALGRFEQRHGDRYPAIGKVWRDAWDRFVPMLDYPPEVRRVFYTTNVVESLNYQLRKITRNRGHFPNDDAGRGAHEVDHAGLHDRVGPDRLDRFGQALEPVHAHEDHVLDAAVGELVADLEPELRTLGLVDPDPQNVPKSPSESIPTAR
jgi:putative transposase